jgi:hypothetical protein
MAKYDKLLYHYYFCGSYWLLDTNSNMSWKMSCFICKFWKKLLVGLMCSVWRIFTCTQCLCVLYEVTGVSGIIRIGLFVYVSSQSLVKPASEDLTSALDENVAAGGDIFREIFEIFVENLVACCIYGSGCKAAYVSTVTSSHRLQSRHCLLTARDQIWRTLRTGQVTPLALSRWKTVISSVRERGVNGLTRF